MDYMGEEYFKLKSTVIKYERFLLKELGFCVHVKHSHKLIITYLQMLEMDKNAALAQRCWNLMNDSLRTNVFVRFSPETIACSCIYLGARQLKIPLPQSPPWWLLFDADYEDMEAVSLELLALYGRPRPLLGMVESEIMKLKEEYQKKQIEIKEVKLKKTDLLDQSKKGLLPTPDMGLVPIDNRQSSQGSPLPPAPSKLPTAKHPPSPPRSELPPTSRHRAVPKSYKVSPVRPPSPPYPMSGRGQLRLPSSGSRATRSVSPLVTHVHSASREPLTPPTSKSSVPSPIRWQQTGSGPSEESNSDSGTPSPIHRGHTPRAYRPVMSPIILSGEGEEGEEEEEGGSDSPSVALRSPSPLSLVRRENGLQERLRDELHDRKIRKSRHRHGDRGNHRGHRERRRVRSRSNEARDHRDHHRRRHHRKEERERERDKYAYEKKRLREREYAYDQRSRKVDHRIRR